MCNYNWHDCFTFISCCWIPPTHMSNFMSVCHNKTFAKVVPWIKPYYRQFSDMQVILEINEHQGVTLVIIKIVRLKHSNEIYYSGFHVHATIRLYLIHINIFICFFQTMISVRRFWTRISNFKNGTIARDQVNLNNNIRNCWV